ncbi:DUF1772 domain-containing protein [Mycolicibacterium iranicum]|uniref:DUF1772 domain-containing protein n=1 Tax=Mycolicibacterium iranicum TaxID=912594 RepID=A0A178M579_MYCIR|nr:anthrone oxygenase family protein [Mycolicibacterium iranicum]OAN42514.1 hypothetical protein A4X20_02225 [Mycolicibacterium iranicum]
MTNPFLIAATGSAVVSAATGGLFYAFSTFVMRGLDRTEPHAAITAMQGMNAEAPANAPFLALFIGSAALAAGVGVATVARWQTPGAGYILAGSILGVVAFGVTVAFNIPLNNALDRLDPSTLSTADAAREWKSYLVPWTNWNHVRTVAPLLGSALVLAGVLQR